MNLKSWAICIGVTIGTLVLVGCLMMTAFGAVSFVSDAWHSGLK